jgi:uncharacterized SAM-binding protein YcdF (DUF218 family)
MAVARSGEPESPPPAAVAEVAPPRGRRWLRRVIAFLALATAACLLLVGVGFAWFVWRLPAEELELKRNADGIVVLTGGASRISDAIELLSSGRGRRLLISGVHPSTGLGEISRSMPEYQRMFSCCIDLDHSARNTLGNALETRRWVRERGFRSLIVVTSNYHMPRAMAELGRQLPGVTLMPFPVVPERLRGESWWSRGANAKLLFSEYLKYMAALLNVRLDRKPISEPHPQSSARADFSFR